MPVLISQGHEWHMLVVTKTSESDYQGANHDREYKECVRCAEGCGRAALAAELGGDGFVNRGF
jgi:hypothetical protein